MCIAPPYQFTENADSVFRLAVPAVIITSGTVINAMLTKRMSLIARLAGGFAIQAVVRACVSAPAVFAALGPMTGVAFVLFTNYMITDPGTTPSKARDQFMFGGGSPLVYGVLMRFNVVYTLFFATTLVCALRGAFLWIADIVAGKRADEAIALAADTRSVAQADAARRTSAGRPRDGRRARCGRTCRLLTRPGPRRMTLTTAVVA